MALINTTTTGVLGTTVFGDGSGDLTIQQNGVLVNKITSNGLTYRGTGSVLQVVSTGIGTAFSTTSGSPVSTGFSLAITPSSASSKVLVIACSSLGVPTSGMNGSVLLYRNSTQLTGPSAPSAVTYGAAAYNQNQFTATVLDSPATTSSTTYTLYAYRDGAAGTFYVGARFDGGSPMVTVITLMEIAA